MLRIVVGALLLIFKLGLLLPVAVEANDNQSPATKRLFDAVWSNAMARVKASIIDGANVNATNRNGAPDGRAFAACAIQ